MVLARVAEWMPERPWLIRGVGVVLMLPALHLLLDDKPGRRLWLWHDSQGNVGSFYEGLTENALTMLLLGVLGLLLVASSFGRRLTGAATGRIARVAGGRPSLAVPTLAGEEAVSMRGIVRGEAGKTG